MICKECGEPMTCGGQGQTLVAYSSPSGHDHNDNCLYRGYTCPNKHTVAVYLRRRCPVPLCGWVGKLTCSCHPGPKLDKWPDAEPAGNPIEITHGGGV